MVHLPTLKWLIDCDYTGRILLGPFSTELKRKLADYIAHFHAFDTVGSPSIPYISAWRSNDKKIWYEFTGSRLRSLLDCQAGEVAAAFSDAIIDRCIYKNPALNQGVTKETLSRQQLHLHRRKLRSRGEQEGHVNAVYKVALKNGRPIWLKDQATIETFANDDITVSRGLLTDVTNEMVAEVELKKVQQELRRHKNHLEDMVKDRTIKLWKSQMEIVARLARAAEYRDNRTGRHLAKMSRYCSVLGDAAGLKKNTNTLLFLAAPMHDIGKIGITDRILLKNGRLDDDEFEQMKTHCDIGARLLSGHNSDLLRVAKTVALCHHEKWDGSGYPRGLAGRDIPLAGRISAICDVFDALTSDRPYKKAWPVERAVTEITSKKGIHFDPKLVDHFVNRLPAIKEIYYSQHVQ